MSSFERAVFLTLVAALAVVAVALAAVAALMAVLVTVLEAVLAAVLVAGLIYVLRQVWEAWTLQREQERAAVIRPVDLDALTAQVTALNTRLDGLVDQHPQPTAARPIEGTSRKH